MSYDYNWKIVMLGDEISGQTSLINSYISGFFIEDQILTTGVDFYYKKKYSLKLRKSI